MTNSKPFDIAHILGKIRLGKILDRSEQLFLDEWLSQNQANIDLYNELLDANMLDLGSYQFVESIDEETAWNNVVRKISTERRLSMFWWAAASIVVIITCGLYLFLPKSLDREDTTKMGNVALEGVYDVLPASIEAKIVLDNGEEVFVRDAFSFLEDQLLTSTKQEGGTDKSININKLIVPTAKYFKITLADGTRVWLNSNSTLEFPNDFDGDIRRVSLDGEGYFEVAKDEQRPFIVKADSVTIRVLGTQFNVSTYDKEFKTSLAEGSIELSRDNKKIKIEPGQSAEWVNGAVRIGITDLKKDLAWKNNIFYFKNDNIVTITDQLKKWYDVDVDISNAVPLTTTYSGEIRRDVNLSSVLEMLSFLSELDFDLQEKKLFITHKKN